MVHLIHYDLKGHPLPADYERLAAGIKNVSGIYCHTPESTWLIETDLTPQQVASRLAPLTQVGDLLFVTRLYNDWYGYSMTPEQIAWLQGRNFASWVETVMALVPLPRPVGSAFSLSRALGGR